MTVSPDSYFTSNNNLLTSTTCTPAIVGIISTTNMGQYSINRIETNSSISIIDTVTVCNSRVVSNASEVIIQ